MQNLLFPSSLEDSFEEFTNRVLPYLSAWGFNSEAVALVLEKCEDTLEALDIIEGCLHALSVCGKTYRPEKRPYGPFRGLCREEAVTEECRKMLDELDIMRNEACLSVSGASWVV